MMVFKKKINIHTIKYISVSYINVALNIIINLILINKVSSYDLGRISIGKTIFQSFEFTHVGIRNGFDRIFPNINNEAEKNEIFQVGLITTLFFSICFFLFWSVYKFNSIIFYSFFTLSGVIYSLVMLFRVYYRSFSDKKKFVKLSAIAILLPSLSELFGFIIYGIHGYLLGFILSYLIILFFVLTKYAIPLKSKFSGLRFGHALKMVLDKGLLLFVSGLITFLPHQQTVY